MTLSNCAYSDDRSPKEIAEAFLKSPSTDDVCIAISSGFVCENEDWLDDFCRVELEYDSHFKQWVDTLTSIWGAVAYRGRWDDKGFPKWAVNAGEIASWIVSGEEVYLRIFQGDRDVPILIALSRPDKSQSRGSLF